MGTKRIGFAEEQTSRNQDVLKMAKRKSQIRFEKTFIAAGFKEPNKKLLSGK